MKSHDHKLHPLLPGLSGFKKEKHLQPHLQEDAVFLLSCRSSPASKAQGCPPGSS